MPQFNKQSQIPCSAQELFDWHARPGAFNRLKPPWDTLSVLEQKGSIYDGDTLKFKIHQGPISITWHAHHEDTIEGKQFCDVQIEGPFKTWHHTHKFVHQDDTHCLLDDHINYTLPLQSLSFWADGPLVQTQLEKMFSFRHTRTMQDITRHQAFKDQPRQTIAITGASGLIGGALTDFFTTGGHTVKKVVRKTPKNDSEIYWKPSEGKIDAEGFEGVDVVIHLAGANVAGKRWTDDYKQLVLKSREQGTTLLATTLANMDKPPHTFISASAVGFYGSKQGDTVLTEDMGAGSGFLAGVCDTWERCAQPASDAGIRTVNSRIGLVLDAGDGILAKMLTPFKLGTGGKLGDGKHYMSWVAIDDICGAMNFLMFTKSIEGPVNLTAPEPVTNAKFTDALGDALNRPTIMTVPKFAMNTAMGKEMAQETAFASQRAIPKKLTDAGFEFFFPKIDGALTHILGK